MKIAIVVTPENPVPPTGYGGGERVAQVMVTQLRRLGHKVHLYAAPGSTCMVDELIEAPVAKMSAEIFLSTAVLQREEEYDCIIDRAAFHMTAFNTSRGNVLGLMCGDPYRRYPHDNVQNRVYVSHEFAAFNDCPDFPVLMNPVNNNPWEVPFRSEGKPGVVYVGVVHPMKGLTTAAAACAEIGREFFVYGPIRDKNEAKLIESCGAKLMGMLLSNPRDRQEAFTHSVFVHPTLVCDADPGAPKEAMLYGTPVVACPNGGITSRIVEGVNGYFATTVDEFASRIIEAERLDRGKVRDSVLNQVNPNRYGESLARLCQLVTDGERW